jgi:predicted nucleic acid-binding protein
MTALNLTIDSFAWIEVIRGTNLGVHVREALQGADEAFTPSIVLAEVSGACHRTGLPDDLIALELSAIREASRVVPISENLSIRSAHALDELRFRAKERRIGPPGLADALVLATAREENSRLLTGDRHFQGLPETIWIQ